MPLPDYGSSRQRDNGRSAQTIGSKSVEDIFSSSTFLTPSIPYKSISRRDPGLVSSLARHTNPDYSVSRHPESTDKPPESTRSKNTFRWIKGELIGRGSHGRVYLGFNATTGEILAVKQVEIPTTADDRRKAELKGIVQRLREERKTLRDLSHPNIVQYLGFEENPETVNIFLEYVSGGTIAGCLREHGPFREEVTKSFTRQILEGLSYLHSNKIIHRDLKSENILIDPNGICKISDFGISKKLEKPRTHTFQGTYNWMAPEVLSNGNTGYDSKVDIWSVGCIVLEMWTATRPWQEENFVKVMIMLSQKRSPPLPKGLILSSLADHFRGECFQLNPTKRPSADMLKAHPYLTSQEGWTFPGMSNMGSLVSPYNIETDNTEAEELPSMDSGTTPTVSTPIPNPPRPISPPLVIIAPPPPRKLPYPQDNMDSWPSTTRYRSASNASISTGNQESSRPQRKLGVHNPNTIPDLTIVKKRDLPQPPKPAPFVYQPPPLPETTAPTPYSNQLGAQTKYAQGSPPARPLRRQQASTPEPQPASYLYLPTKINRMGPANLKDIMSQQQSSGSNSTNHSDGSCTTTTTTITSTTDSVWQRPPPNVVIRSRSVPSNGATSEKPQISRKRPSLPPTPFTPPHRAQPAEPPTPQKRSPVAANARPRSRDVLEHMKVYFPDHNLDEPVVSTEVDAASVSIHEITPLYPMRRIAFKSIKAIAEEQIHRDPGPPNRKRQTVLWDSHIEEIKASKHF